MSHAAFSMNHAARKNATGTGNCFSASSSRPRTFNKLGLGASAPIVESATTFFGFAAARAVYIDAMNFRASGNPGAGSNTGGSIAKTPSVPSNALVSAPTSAKSATATSQPSSAHAAPLLRSRTTARTCWSAERRLRATAAPTFPVIPVTAYMFAAPVWTRLPAVWEHYLSAGFVLQQRLCERSRDFKSGIDMAFDGKLLSGVTVLIAVVEAGTIARAAEALGLSPSGVSRALSRLERRVGARLLARTTRSLSLTDEGRRFYEQVGPHLAGIEEAAIGAAGSASKVGGRLGANIDPFFSRIVLSRHLAAFLARYPELSVELIMRDSVGDLVADGFDLALRFGEPPVGSFVARKLLETRVLTVASPSYIKVHGRPRHPKEIEERSEEHTS